MAGGVVVLGAVVIAACFGEAELRTSTQSVIEAEGGSNVDFGSVTHGSSATQTITLRPLNGSAYDDMVTSISIASCPAFSLAFPNGSAGRVYCPMVGSGTGVMTVAPAVEPNGCEYLRFDATFAPTGGSADACSVTINYTPLGGSATTYSVYLTGTGVPIPAGLDVSPTLISFGDHLAFVASDPTRVTITNTGGNSLTVVGTNPTHFTVSSVNNSNFGSQFLAPGAFAEFDVRCVPQNTGVLTGDLSFVSAAGTHLVALDCTGIDPSNLLTINPSPASFAPTLVGRPAEDLDITITKNGGSTILTASLTATNPDLSIVAGFDPNNQAVGSGGSFTARLRYAATTSHVSGPLGTLIVNYTGGTARNITINGEALVGEIGTSPAIVDFGPVCVGATIAKDVMVYASAAGDVTLSSVTGAAAPFSVTGPTGTLQGNHGNTLDVSASVSPTEPGNLEDQFVLNTNLPTNPSRSITLKAIALPPGVTPTPDLVHFGPGQVGTTTAAKTIVLSNCGNTAITITGARIQGASANDFAIVSPANPAMPLLQQASLEFLVVMSPQRIGTKAAQLVIEYDGGTVAVDLDGNGFGGDDSDQSDRGTYYACSSGHGSSAALAPLALALLLVRRRRRRA